METKTELANSSFNTQLTSFTITTDLQKAWHISAVLLSLRRPVRPVELAFRCTLFCTTPELIEVLCSIPNSPLCLTPCYLVTLSSMGYLAISEFLANSNVTLTFLPRFRFESGLKTYFRKRKRMRLEGDESLPKRRGPLQHFGVQGGNAVVIRNDYAEACFSDGNMSRGLMAHSSGLPMEELDTCQLGKAMLRTFLFINSSNELPEFGIGSTTNSYERETSLFTKRNQVDYSSTIGCQIISLDCLRCQTFLPAIPEHEKIRAHPFQEMSHHSAKQNPALSLKAHMNDEILAKKMSSFGSSTLELQEQLEDPEKEDETVHPCETIVEGLKVMDSNQDEPYRGYFGNLLIKMTRKDRSIKDKQLESDVGGCNQMIPSIGSGKEETLNNPTILISNSRPPDQGQLASTSSKLKFDQKQPCQNLHSTARNPKTANALCSPLRQLHKNKDKKFIPSKQHLSHNVDRKMGVKEKQETADKLGKNSFISSHDQVEQRVLPNFESFIVEEEEGSGGYGTVYRARRKTDGVIFAIKSPHVNANRNHVHNEVKMLERFGGKNFVIRYEGSFKSGNSDCLVLEHVEHDRPEVLKRDINVCELQWYGYCMFRALAGLHKQSIVHRDVKPGNFLFNRKACKGFLIDFNLAMDLNHKYCSTDKTQEGHNVNFDHVPISSTKSRPPTKSRKFPTIQDINRTHNEQGKVSKAIAVGKDMRKKIGKYNPHADIGTRTIIKSQGADGSGITSAKDVTSTKTLSVEKFREPLPCQGRKELINLVQEALQGANHEAVNAPVSKRKRIAALPGKVDHKFVYLTPMPLHSAGGVGGSGLLKSKGDGKSKREGPCVGTKGFRAPEVLFRSQYQGPKVDIWSAGVSLLYLMIGRTPFVGDPDQNTKEIAKIRGSEVLWEVAKLHNRESFFPVELLDIKALPSMKLQDWCKLNTRRPDFLNVIPSSLFDLVDKCLTVNPRLRISAEEALRHEFFTPCQEALRKHRLLRQGVSLDSGSSQSGFL